MVWPVNPFLGVSVVWREAELTSQKISAITAMSTVIVAAHVHRVVLCMVWCKSSLTPFLVFSVILFLPSPNSPPPPPPPSPYSLCTTFVLLSFPLIPRFSLSVPTRRWSCLYSIQPPLAGTLSKWLFLFAGNDSDAPSHLNFYYLKRRNKKGGVEVE